jgi:Ti-type conjugative transfer relaxase TraA
MILEANERAYGAELARHLLNPRDNDHVTVHDLYGFIADDLFGAFAEAEAISGATRCQKYLFSLSLNPPPNASVPVEVFERTIASVEKELGLVGQPRAIVFHEKNGRRHAHCVWSRIKADDMRAINIAHYKRKLTSLSREIYLEHRWDMPLGFEDKQKRDPNNYSRAEAGQAKRSKRNPQKTKALFRRCWEGSDTRASFEAALREEGYLLARGERRGFVAVDGDGKIWSLSRWCGVKTKDLCVKLGEEEMLPTVEDVQPLLADLPPVSTIDTPSQTDTRRAILVAQQRAERRTLLDRQEERRITELTARQARLPQGLKAIFWRVTRKFQDAQRQFEQEAARAKERDRAEQQQLIERHIAERRAIDREAQRVGLAKPFQDALGRDPRQTLELPDDDLSFTKTQLQNDPTLILGHISHTKARFNRADILRGLAKRIDDPQALTQAANTAVQSPELITIQDGKTTQFTTKDYRAAEEKLRATSQVMDASRGPPVSDAHVTSAMAKQDRAMQRAFGGSLSEEQCTALRHLLDGKQLACVVGLAGAGKSTMLATAKDAWARQGIAVHGAALAGKAADGLETASGISSRTLASLELSWKNGYEPIAQGDVLVVDEAGMIGTRQMARISSKLNDIGAKLVLIGDPDQLQPIEAGTPFRDVIADVGAARLTEIHRQREDWQKKASRDLADGNTAQAVQLYREDGAVKQDHTREETIEALVEAYTMDVAASGDQHSRMAFAHRRKDVHALNQAIRAKLRATDNPPEEILFQTETGKRAFATGDRIVFGRNDRKLGVKNGMLGTVAQARDGKIKVALDGEIPRTKSFDPHTYRSFDHGYAVTIHKSQGATVDQAYVLGSRTMDNHLAYVAMTRHRDAMTLYISAEDRPKWAQSPRPERSQTRNRDGPSMG